MEQRRHELALARLKASLQEKLIQIETLETAREEKFKRLQVLKESHRSKFLYFESMKRYSELGMEVGKFCRLANPFFSIIIWTEMLACENENNRKKLRKSGANM